MNPVNEQIGANARIDPKKWAKRILERYENKDGTVSPIALQMARAALNGSFRSPKSRTPGEDDV